MHPRVWLLACMGWLMVWSLPAQASWEAYQQDGEAAYDRGDYETAERMFLAAVREARHFGPQDSRLDISLNKLALLRVARGAHSEAAGSAHSEAAVSTQRVTRRKSHTRKPGQVRRGHRRPPARQGLQHARPGRQHHASSSARSGGRRQGTRTTVARPAHRSQRPHATLPRVRPTRQVAPPVRHGKRREAVRTPRLQHETPRRQRGHTLQQSRATYRHTGKMTGRPSPTRDRHK
jgi:hypothetical protein